MRTRLFRIVHLQGMGRRIPEATILARNHFTSRTTSFARGRVQLTRPLAMLAALTCGVALLNGLSLEY